MGDDDDAHLLLEEAFSYDKQQKGSNDRSNDARRSKSDRSGDHRGDRRRSRSRSPRERGGDRDRDSRRSDRDRVGSERDRGGDRSNGSSAINKEKSNSDRDRVVAMGRLYAPPPSAPRTRDRSPSMPKARDLTPEERDARTVFCMQLAARIRRRDLMDFFSTVGKVNDVKLITDAKTGRHKGIAYVEFDEKESAKLAQGLAGQKVCGVPIVVQPSMAEKNRAAAMAAQQKASSQSIPMDPIPMINPSRVGSGAPAGTFINMTKIYIGNLHPGISQSMLKSIVEPFGEIQELNLAVDELGQSQGYGSVAFRHADDCTKALQQLSGFEVAGRQLKVSYVTERLTSQMAANPSAMIPTSAIVPSAPIGFGMNMGNAGNTQAAAAAASGLDSAIIGPSLDNDEIDRTGVGLGARGRIQLMAKLAEGTGLKLPHSAQQMLKAPTMPTSAPAPPIATPCFVLSNMFDPIQEDRSGNPTWDADIADDVIDECVKHGGILHVFVDKNSPQGNVYCKCPSVLVAQGAVNALHGRWFGGKMITAAYVPMPKYHELFPKAASATTPLMPRG